MIGIIGAMDVEVSDIKEKLQNIKITKKGIYEFIEGTLYNKEVVLLKSGIGKVSSAVGTSLLIELYSPEFIINTGIAGGSEGLYSEDIVLSEKLLYGDVDATVFGYSLGQVPQMPRYYESNTNYLERIKSILESNNYNYKLGTSITCDSFITSPKVLEPFNYINMICEMEGASIAQACHLFNIPFVSIRFISDILGEKSQIDNYNEFETKMAHRSCNIILDIIRNI